MKEPKVLRIANSALKNCVVTIAGIEHKMDSRNPMVVVDNPDDAKSYVASKNFFLSDMSSDELIKWYRNQMNIIEAKVEMLEAKIIDLESKKPKKA